ncbi:Uncharacterised protein [Mycobacteroides abscessus subsp. abscessus]|nr:Uncharacterised protein [Mycobacteroides abscessus subsp. abscessus]
MTRAPVGRLGMSATIFENSFGPQINLSPPSAQSICRDGRGGWCLTWLMRRSITS